MNTPTFTDQLRALVQKRMNEHNISLREVSRKSGASLGSISRWLNSGRGLSSHTADNLISWLDLKLVQVKEIPDDKQDSLVDPIGHSV